MPGALAEGFSHPHRQVTPLAQQELRLRHAAATLATLAATPDRDTLGGKQDAPNHKRGADHGIGLRKPAVLDSATGREGGFFARAARGLRTPVGPPRGYGSQHLLKLLVVLPGDYVSIHAVCDELLGRRHRICADHRNAVVKRLLDHPAP
jgi:hypothetical protein